MDFKAIIFEPGSFKRGKEKQEKGKWGEESRKMERVRKWEEREKQGGKKMELKM